MIPLVVGFQVRCRSWLFVKPFSRDLPISEPEVTAKLAPEATRFRLRPLCSREKGDSYRHSPSLPRFSISTSSRFRIRRCSSPLSFLIGGDAYSKLSVLSWEWYHELHFVFYKNLVCTNIKALNDSKFKNILRTYTGLSSWGKFCSRLYISIWLLIYLEQFMNLIFKLWEYSLILMYSIRFNSIQWKCIQYN